MTACEPLSARLNAAFDGCYEAHRASALSGVPHLAGSRVTTLSAAALYKSLGDYEAVAGLYPGFDTEAFRDAVELESSLAA